MLINANNNVTTAFAESKEEILSYTKVYMTKKAEKNESMVIVSYDTGAYNGMCSTLKAKGYKVQILNEKDLENSNRWNCLLGINFDDGQLKKMQILGDIIIRNAEPSNKSKDPIWDNMETTLLNALCLLVVTDEARDDTQKNIGAVYELLASTSEARLTAMFDRLSPGHPARTQWSLFRHAPENARGLAMVSLGVHLQTFLNQNVASTIGPFDINLNALSKEKTALFIIPKVYSDGSTDCIDRFMIDVIRDIANKTKEKITLITIDYKFYDSHRYLMRKPDNSDCLEFVEIKLAPNMPDDF